MLTDLLFTDSAPLSVAHARQQAYGCHSTLPALATIVYLSQARPLPTQLALVASSDPVCDPGRFPYPRT